MATHPHTHAAHGSTMGHHHHAMPASAWGRWSMAVSATLHCLTGCAIGEIAGMAIGTALGLSNPATIVLATVLAFAFGYALTSIPLLRAGMALGAVIPIALASDTFSIAVMEAVDNAVVALVPGAMDAGLASLLFWGTLAFALSVAFVVAVPVNRWLIARGRGHAVVHGTGVHGGPSPRLIGAVLAVAFAFGAAVLIAEASTGGDAGHGTPPAHRGVEHTGRRDASVHPVRPGSLPWVAVAPPRPPE